MARCRLRTDALHQDECIEQLQETALYIIRFIAVHIDQPIILQCQLDGLMNRLLAELPGQLEVRNRTDAVRAHLQSLFYQLIAALVGIHALLRERHDLKIEDVLHFLSNLEGRLETGKRRIRHIDVRTDRLDAMEHLLLNTTVDPLLHLRHRHVPL